MKHSRSYWQSQARSLVWLILAGVGLAWVLLHHLGSLPGGMSAGEIQTAVAPVGWHGIWHHPLDLPLQLLRSPVFWIAPHHGALLTRLPNAFFGALAVISFGWLIWLWHGPRTTLFATLLFATSAWTLHVSRLASFDVLYLWAVPTLLLTQFGLQQHSKHPIVWYGTLLLWGFMLYIPGLIWLLLLSVYLQRKALLEGWRHFSGIGRRILSVLAILVWIPLLGIDLMRPGQLALWLGLPHHLASPVHLVKQFGGVFVHLFIRGPQYPEVWLARAPILGVFTLVACGLGIYFYATNWKSRRTKLLGAMFAIGTVLVALGGPVGLSILVPLLFMAAATGMAYLLRDWLKVFPLNPLARGLGIGLVALLVGLTCVYNLRAYYVAWPHNAVTEATFRYHRP